MLTLLLFVALSGGGAADEQSPRAAPIQDASPFEYHAREPSGPTYADRIAGSAAFFDLRCARTFGVVTPNAVAEVYGHIHFPEEASEDDFRQLEAAVKQKLADAGYRRQPADFSAAEMAMDLSKTKYLSGVPLHEYELARFRAYLRAMREPDLATATDESYRLLWWRAFDLPVSVRVVSAPSGATLVAKMLGSAEGAEPGMLCARVEKRISAAEFESLRACFSAPSIWKTDYDERDRRRRDGSKWILEARKRDGYAFGKLRSPKGGALYRCGMRLLDLSGLPKGEVY